MIGYERTALSEPIRTELPNPATLSPTITTYYFEREFEFSGDPNDTDTQLALRHLIDDGAVFYLNGEEVLRFNLPNGPLDSSTIASPSVNNATLSDIVPLPTQHLRSGTNRLAVEVHQASVASNDVVFGVELSLRKLLTPGIPGQPFRESDEEWIELYNRSPHRTIDLSVGNWAMPYDSASRRGPRSARSSIASWPPTRPISSTQHPELAGQVIGEFRGQLSNRDETIRLLDAQGNPADEVHYYDDGRWDHAADGGGSSLELVDPFADNAQPEAWSASIESDDSLWQTITYRDIVRPDGFTNGITSRYHELILGMLDAGVVLIDDISVIEDPDRAAIERIQNGQFETDALNQPPQHWRIRRKSRGGRRRRPG